MEAAKTFGPCRICGEPTRNIAGLGRGHVHMVCYAEECDRVRRDREAYERGDETRRMKSWRPEPPAHSYAILSDLVSRFGATHEELFSRATESLLRGPR